MTPEDRIDLLHDLLSAPPTKAAARPSMFKLLSDAIGTILVVSVGVIFASYLMWWFVPISDTGANTNPAQATAEPTTRPTATRERAQGGPSAPFSGAIGVPADPIPGIAQNEATATALFNAAVQAGETQTAPDPAPAILVTKPSVREGAGANVPTAEPVVVVTDWFGSKQAPVNIQETHECKHGQVWVEGKGCRNP